MNIVSIFIDIFRQYLFHIILSFSLFFILSRFKRGKNIKGQKILITGAGNGLGRQLAIQFSKHSACLILMDIDKTALQMTEKMMEQNSTVFLYQCDISDCTMMREVAKKIKMDVGDVDILVNNAGIVSGKYFLDLSEEQIKKTMEVNALAHFWTCKAFLPAMMAKNRGHIISVTSIVSKMVLTHLTDYCSSKFAAHGFAEALEMELRSKKLDGIKVTVVLPCHMDTGLFHGTKTRIVSIMTPEYAAKEIIKGVLEERETIFLPHYVKYIIMLKELCPRWLFIWLQDMAGNVKCMETFTGRKKRVDDQQPQKQLTNNGFH